MPRLGRPRTKRTKRTERLLVPITEEEHEALFKMAEAVKAPSVSAFVRELVFSSDAAEVIKFKWEE